MTDNTPLPRDPAVLAAYLLVRSEPLTEAEREQAQAILGQAKIVDNVVAVFDSDQDPEFFFRQQCHLAHAMLITASGITPAVALRRGYRSVDSAKELARLGFAQAQQRPGLVFPVRDVKGNIAFHQLRPDEPRLNAKGKPIKYETPRGARLVLDVPPGARRHLDDPKVPLFVTEGARKADSAVSAGLCCASINGTYGWRGTDAKGNKGPLACWKSVALKGRTVYIVFDSDVSSKPEVREALARFRGFLKGRGADALVIYLEPGSGGEKVGLDDYLASGHTVAELTADPVRGMLAVRRPGGDEDAGPGPALKPVIVVGAQGLTATAGRAWAAVLAANDPPVIYRNGDELVRVTTDHKTKAPRLIVMTVPRMANRADLCAEWVKESGKPAYPDLRVIADMLSDHDAPVPLLNRIITVPGFTADGRLLDAAGYDKASGILYAPPADLDIPPVPDEPTDDEVARARGLLLDEMLVNFPFVSAADKAAAVATLLGAFARGLIAGSTPLMMFEKPAPRTGAGLLIDSISRVVLGRDAPKSVETKEEEWRKRITSILLEEAPTYVVLDNLRRRLDSAALASALTTCVWSDRVLGLNKWVTLYVECLWVATANNPKLSTEMAGRTVSCRMDAKVERPGERTEFRHPQQLQWISENRADLVWSCLTLVRRWLTDGSPAGTEVMGGFESWCRVMGGILRSAGIPGLLANREQFYQRADDEGDTIKPFIAAWWQRFHGEKVPAKELLPVALETIEIEAKTEHARRTRLGQLLKGERDRRYRLAPDLEVCVAGALDGHDKGFRWWLARVEPKPIAADAFWKLDESNVDLASPEQIAKIVMAAGGLRPSPETQDVPLRYKNSAGPPLDELAKRILIAQPCLDLDEQVVSDKLAWGLDQMSRLHRRDRDRRVVDPDDPANDLPADLTPSPGDDEVPF